ncbi:MAG: DNA polymerase III subunit delta [Armatimonadota bacterium]|nr:DNA polymerase III subunit delta [Armatimonadota bacterium]
MADPSRRSGAPGRRDRAQVPATAAGQAPERPVLIIGEEDYLAEQILAQRIEAALSPEEQRLNLDVLDASMPVADLLTRLDTAPFFGRFRVVVVRRLEAMREADWPPLVAYLERGGSPNRALFVARELDRRRLLFLTFKRLGEIVEARPLPPRDLPSWVGGRLAALGKQMAPGAAETLVALVGGSLRDLDHEAAKVAAYVGDRALVRPADVEAIATRTGEASIFTLTDALGGGDGPAALRALHDILATHEPLQVLFMVARQFRLILRAHTLAGSREAARSPAILAERLGVPPYIARKIRDQALGYRAEHFPGIFAALEAADRAIKTGMPPRLALETLFVRLCETRRRAPHREIGARA